MIGIYKIENIINNKCYYGSSKNIEKRCERHKNELNKNTHINCFIFINYIYLNLKHM